MLTLVAPFISHSFRRYPEPLGHSRLTYLAIVIGVALWCGAIVSAPLGAGEEGIPGAVSHGIYSMFGKICHQLPGRSWNIHGHPLAACERCSAVYFGFFAGAVLLGLARHGLRRRHTPSRTIMLVALIPLLADVVAGVTGIVETGSIGRACTGVWFGLLASRVIVPDLACRPTIRFQERTA